MPDRKKPTVGPLTQQQQVETYTTISEFRNLLQQLNRDPDFKKAVELAGDSITQGRNLIQIVYDDLIDRFYDASASAVQAAENERELFKNSAGLSDIADETLKRLREVHRALYKARHRVTKDTTDEDIDELFDEGIAEVIAERAKYTEHEKSILPRFLSILQSNIPEQKLLPLASRWLSLDAQLSTITMTDAQIAASLNHEMYVESISAYFNERGQRLAGASAGVNGQEEENGVIEWIEPGESPVSFKDVAGIDSAVEDVQDILDFLTDPEKFARLGAKIPKGALFEGPPGTGKTLLARAMAGEAGIPMAVMSGSEFVEKYVGVGAQRVRELFAEARERSPCIIFIDEIDAIGKSRGAGGDGGSDEREATLNQLLTEMDGVKGDKGIICIAATNRAELLDSALTRPGRFDRVTNVPVPTPLGREKILEVHTKDKPLAADVDIKFIAQGTTGYSGAELANLANEAAILAAKNDQTEIKLQNFLDARDNVSMGRQNRSLILLNSEIESTAYHEIGHALLTYAMEPYTMKFERVTIVPRGGALGVSQSIPKEGRASRTLTEFKAGLRVTMGGRAAEEIIYGEHHITSGASNDLGQATQTAKAMVANYGFGGDDLGLVRYDSFSDLFGRNSQGYQPSDATKSKVDDAVKQLNQQAYDDAIQFLKANKDIFVKLTEELCDKETLERSDFERIVGDRSLLKDIPLQEERESKADKVLAMDADHEKELNASGGLPPANDNPQGGHEQPGQASGRHFRP